MTDVFEKPLLLGGGGGGPVPTLHTHAPFYISEGATFLCNLSAAHGRAVWFRAFHSCKFGLEIYTLKHLGLGSGLN